MTPLKKPLIPAVVGILLTMMPVLTSSFITYEVVIRESMFAAWTTPEWLMATLVCCVTSTFALTPPTFLALVFGYFLGWSALLPVFALNMSAIMLVNLLVRFMNQPQLLTYLEHNKKARQVLTRIQQRELWFIFFAKLSPVLPFALTNLVFALSGARLRNILLGGFMGMVPRTVLAVGVGLQAQELRQLLEHPNQVGWMQWITIILLLISVVGLWLVLGRYKPAEVEAVNRERFEP